MEDREPVLEIHGDRSVRVRARRIYFASGVDCDPARCDGKGRTGLQPTQPWRPLNGRVVWANLDGTELPEGIGLVAVDAGLCDRIRTGIVERGEHLGHSSEQELPRSVADELTAALNMRLPGTWDIDEAVTVRRSWPGEAPCSEHKGGGLSFDDSSTAGLTVSLNTGDAARYAQFALEDRDEITWYDRQADIYDAVATLNPTIYAVEIHPGEGWMMATERRLHGSGRAEPGRFSSVVVLRAQPRNARRANPAGGSL